MANKQHVALLLKGSDIWNDWRDTHSAIKPDLKEADLSGADLAGANLKGADLSRANLNDTKLSGANLVSARLDGARLANCTLMMADLAGASLMRTDLICADLMEAYLGAADLTRAKLYEATLHRATMARTKLVDLDLSTTKGLEAVTHRAPSSIGIDTIYLSKGKIPSSFLRGAGVPEIFIEYMSSLTGKSFEYYSCFISYSNKDDPFAKRLYADLQAHGVRCWFAPHDIQGGKKLHEQIDSAIRIHERLLLILSPASINSEWVKTEIAKARRREVNERTRVLFPVRVGISFEQLREWEYFDADIGKSSAREIREYYIPDFSDWKSHDRYETEFAKLLRDLQKSCGR